MHVHALIDTLYTGGAENLLLDFAAGARQRGIETTVSYLSPSDRQAVPRLQALGIEPRPIDVSRLLSPQARRLVRDDLAAAGPDVLHTHLASSDYLGALAGRNLGVPVVSTLHSAALPPGPRARLRHRLAARARRRADARIIAVSEAARSHYLASYARQDPKRVVTVHNGILADARPGAGAAIRAGLGIDLEALVVATVSVLKPGKGHGLAVDLIAELRGRGIVAELLVLGDGPMRGEVEAMMQQLGGHGHVLGHRDDVEAVLDAVDIVLHPSLADAFPGALLDAMAASVPVLASDVGGIPEIVVAETTGLLAPPTLAEMIEPLEALASDSLLRERLGRAGRARLDAEFTVERWMERLIPVYEEAMAER